MVAAPGVGTVPGAFASGLFAQGMPGLQGNPSGFLQPRSTAFFAGRPAVNILPHPSHQGVGKAARKARARSHPQNMQARSHPQGVGKNQATNSHASTPQFLADAKSMLVCRVSLGRLGIGTPGLRLPPKGADAVTCTGGTVFPQALVGAIFAVFDNAQAYPEYVVHFKPK